MQKFNWGRSLQSLFTMFTYKVSYIVAVSTCNVSQTTTGATLHSVLLKRLSTNKALSLLGAIFISFIIPIFVSEPKSSFCKSDVWDYLLFNSTRHLILFFLFAKNFCLFLWLAFSCLFVLLFVSLAVLFLLSLPVVFYKTRMSKFRFFLLSFFTLIFFCKSSGTGEICSMAFWKILKIEGTAISTRGRSWNGTTLVCSSKEFFSVRYWEHR